MKQYHLKNGSVIVFSGNWLPKDRIRELKRYVVTGEKESNMKEEDNFVRIKGIRTNCITGEEKEVIITLEKYYHASNLNSWWVRIIKGGVTGYESLEVSRMAFSRGWLACGGTKDRWDRLYIPADQMQKLEPIFGVGKNEQR